MNSRGFAALRGVRGGDCVGEISMAISVFENASSKRGTARVAAPPRRGRGRPSDAPPLSSRRKQKRNRGGEKGAAVVSLRGRGNLKRLRGRQGAWILDIWGNFEREN